MSEINEEDHSKREQWIVLSHGQFVGPFESERAAERWAFFNKPAGVFRLHRKSEVPRRLREVS
jgi:hypothetical protein